MTLVDNLSREKMVNSNELDTTPELLKVKICFKIFTFIKDADYW